MRTSFYDYCAARKELGLLKQWHPVKNRPLTPGDVSYGSKRKLWWLCPRGHEWQAAVYTRTSGSGCPYCAGKLAWPGENDLASQRPDIAAQWHPTKNAPVTPEEVTVGSHHKAWWVCEQGHEWRAEVKSRTLGGTGCPVCTGRLLRRGVNDLAATHPDLAAQWHPAKNGTLTPQEVMAGSTRKVWWQCGSGHTWQARISSRACGGAGCPVCAGKLVVAGENDLESRFPAIAAQWHPEKNGSLTPSDVSPYSNRRVWWRDELGHAWQAAVSARTQHGSGCPYCTGKTVLPGFNDLATLVPGVAAQWHPTLNGALTPEQVTAGSRRMAWWQCPSGHIWRAVIYSRAGPQKCGCPVCAGKVRPERQERYRRMLAEAEKRAGQPIPGPQSDHRRNET